jgi:hypothetical protein
MEEIMISLAAVWRTKGGLTRLAHLLGEPISTVHSWKRRGRVPRWRRGQIEDALRTFDEFGELGNGRRP